MTEPITDQQLDEIETRHAAATKGPWRRSEDYSDIVAPDGSQLASYWMSADGEFIAHAPDDVRTLLDEVRRQRTELAAAHGQAISWAADAVDEKLTAERDYNRASALYELLLGLRGELPCTCARSGGLHSKGCRKYVPGHELISRQNQLAVYRAAAVAPDAASVPPGAPVRPVQASSVSESAQSPTGASEGALGDSAAGEPPNPYANGVCTYGEDQAPGSGCIKPAGHDGAHYVTPGDTDTTGQQR